MKIILVRHGESEHNAKITLSRDSKLTKKGEIQAKHLGEKIKNKKIKIDAIYTSNLIRSKKTAEIISKIIKSYLFLPNFFKALSQSTTKSKE